MKSRQHRTYVYRFLPYCPGGKRHPSRRQTAAVAVGRRNVVDTIRRGWPFAVRRALNRFAIPFCARQPDRYQQLPLAYGKTRAQWDIGMVAGPYFAHGTATAGDFLHFIAPASRCRPDEQTALELIVRRIPSTDGGSVGSSVSAQGRRSLSQRHSVSFASPNRRAMITRSVCRRATARRTAAAISLSSRRAILTARNSSGHAVRPVPKVDFCGFHVEIALTQRRCRKVSKSSNPLTPTTQIRCADNGQTGTSGELPC